MVFYLILGIILIFLLPLLVELIISLTSRRQKRRGTYQNAQERSKQTGKPLLVVGDPDTGCINHYLGRDYQCGDICLDLTGCPGCPRQIKGDLVTEMKKLQDDSCVIFVSCTLEYLPNLETAIKELERVSGDHSNLFVVAVESYSPLHFLFSGTQNIILNCPPNQRKINYCKVPKVYKILQKIYGPLTRSSMAGKYIYHS